MKEEKQIIVEQCEHTWEDIGKEKRSIGSVKATLWNNGYIFNEYRILQRCKKCNKLNVINF